MALLLYRYRHALRLNFTMLRNLCWTRYLTNFYKISFLHWVSIGNFIFINFFPKCSCEAVKCLYFSWPGADMVLHALPCTFVHLPLVYRTPRYVLNITCMGPKSGFYRFSIDYSESSFFLYRCSQFVRNGQCANRCRTRLFLAGLILFTFGVTTNWAGLSLQLGILTFILQN